MLFPILATTFGSILRSICDLDIRKKDTKGFGKTTQLTTKIDDVLNHPNVDVVVELIGGLKPARRLVEKALRKGKHVVTANKALIAECGKKLFALAQKNNCRMLAVRDETGQAVGIVTPSDVSDRLFV